MATVIFYEKPGCINNTKQKVLLRAAGHQVDDRNLLTTAWTPAELCSFFGDRPVPEWFNPSAPHIKSGEVNPAQLDAETALALMVQQPLLIRRPLIQVGDRRAVGFDLPQIEAWIGLTPADPLQQIVSHNLIHQDLEHCPRQQDPVLAAHSCP